ncbi:MAG: MMPL family transporter, partial [Aeromicrobium sp.]
MSSATQVRPPAGASTHWIGRFLTRRVAPWVALVPLLLAVVSIVAFGDGERDELSTDTLPSGTQSAQSVALIDALPETDDAAVVVFEATSGAFAADSLQQVQDLATELGATGAVTVAKDGSAAIAAVPLDASNVEESTQAVKDLRADLADGTPKGVEVSVTGPDAVSADLDAVFDGANVKLLGSTVAVVALLLVITYRSPVLFVIPLLVVGVADRLASVVATHVMASLDVAFSVATTSILSILVFGAGTDYALLLISRYRSELATHES